MEFKILSVIGMVGLLVIICGTISTLAILAMDHLCEDEDDE